MLRTTFQSLLVLAALLGLSSCAQKPTAQLEDTRQYNVRVAAITADQGVSPAIALGIQQGINDSIASTYRSATAPEVELNARLSSIGTVSGPQGPVYVMKITTALTSLRDGNLVSVGEFQVASAEKSRKSLENTLRDNASAQLRYAYGLTPPMPKSMRMPRANNMAMVPPGTTDPMMGMDGRPAATPLTPEQMKEQALLNPDPVLNQNSMIDTSKDPLLAPGMASAQPDPMMKKPKQTKPGNNGMAKNTVPDTNDLTKLNKEMMPAPAANNAANQPSKMSTPPVVVPAAPVTAAATPDTKQDPKLPPAKAYSNLENGAATNIAIPAKTADKPAATAPASTANATPAAPEPAPVTAAPPAAQAAQAAPVPGQPAAPMKPAAPGEPCVVTITNGCVAPATK